MKLVGFYFLKGKTGKISHVKRYNCRINFSLAGQKVESFWVRRMQWGVPPPAHERSPAQEPE